MFLTNDYFCEYCIHCTNRPVSAKAKCRHCTDSGFLICEFDCPRSEFKDSDDGIHNVCNNYVDSRVPMLESDPHDFERLHTGATAPERRKVEELLLESITHERAHQNEEHGEKFNSVPEAVAVLIEEIEEGSEEFNRVIKTAHDAWKDVRQDDSVDFVNKMEDIYRFAKFAAMECVQVAAVARKAIESIESEGAK